MKSSQAILIIILAGGLLSSCKKSFTSSGVVADAVSRQGIGDATIEYSLNPQLYPLDDDSFEVVGSSGSNGDFEVDGKPDYNWGYFIAEKNRYWCAWNFGSDYGDTIFMLRESCLRITLHDNPNMNNTGTFGYRVDRTYPSSSSYLVAGQWGEVIEYASNIPVTDGETFDFRLAGDIQNDLQFGAGFSTGAGIDTILQITPAWGDTLNFSLDY